MDPSVLPMQALVLENSGNDTDDRVYKVVKLENSISYLMRDLNLHYQRKNLVELTGGDIDDLERCIYKLERDLRDLKRELYELKRELRD